MTTVVVRAYAKLNLSLRIVGRRDDGFHELRTVFQSVGLHDTLTFRSQSGPFTIECDAPDVPRDRRNLVWRAADRVWRASGRRGTLRGVSVTIRKRVPAQAGLGGGSSDAAATLVALDALWKTRLSPARLAAVASALGSDVPFFLLGGTALGLGRGEELFALPPIPPVPVVVVRPPCGVGTADAYAWFSSAGRARRTSPAPQTLAVPWSPVPLTIENDLERAVLPRVPLVAEARRRLRRAGATAVLMSGSGSAVFGLFPDAASARRAASVLTQPGWFVQATHTMGASARPRPREIGRPRG
jgi:4-diphosphocytidyl-2-C-methyl-D-erythritol kinase